MNFDLNVDAMTRDQLERAYFDVVFMVEEYGQDEDDLDDLMRFFNKTFGDKRYHGARATGKQNMMLVNALLDGKSHTAGRLAAAITIKNIVTEDHVKVVVCRCRKFLKEIGVEITTVWGGGFFMPEDSIEKFKALMEASQ